MEWKPLILEHIFPPSTDAVKLLFPILNYLFPILNYYMGYTLPCKMATWMQDIDNQDINKIFKFGFYFANT